MKIKILVPIILIFEFLKLLQRTSGISVQNMSWKSSTKSTLSRLNSSSCVHIRLSQVVFYLSLFKCIFEALRGISGGSFQAEGMCRSSRTNQIWSLQCRELPGTCSILSLKIRLLTENHVPSFSFSKAKESSVFSGFLHVRTFSACHKQKLANVPEWSSSK